MKKLLVGIIMIVGASYNPQAQTMGTVTIDGNIYPFSVDECGDTIILASLQDVAVSSFRTFDDPDDFRRYRLYRHYATIVYPYAVEAIRQYREVEYAETVMGKRKYKKFVKNLHNELKDEYKDPLKGLTKTQGLILTKMIERELDTPIFYVVKELRGGLTAFYWGTISSFAGYHLKDGYTEGEDEVLDAVLQDFNISYTLPSSRKHEIKALGKKKKD